MHTLERRGISHSIVDSISAKEMHILSSRSRHCCQCPQLPTSFARPRVSIGWPSVGWTGQPEDCHDTGRWIWNMHRWLFVNFILARFLFFSSYFFSLKFSRYFLRSLLPFIILKREYDKTRSGTLVQQQFRWCTSRFCHACWSVCHEKGFDASGCVAVAPIIDVARLSFLPWRVWGWPTGLFN